MHLQTSRGCSLVMALLLTLVACGGGGGGASPDGPGPVTPPAALTYTLDAEASGISETVSNAFNLTVVSKDANVLKAEYKAGFVQGHVQGASIQNYRDNFLYGNYFGVPPAGAMASINAVLSQNFTYLVTYLKTSPSTPFNQALTRMLFRMVGIYHGATLGKPADLDFSGSWLPDASYFTAGELKVAYGQPLSFMDLYLVNAGLEVLDVLSWGTPSPTVSPAQWAQAQSRVLPLARQHCTSFLKRLGNDVVLTHTSWDFYLSQSQTVTINVNGDMVTMNAIGPGQISSATDFGFNNRGIMFNETTNGRSAGTAKANGIFLFLRAGIAEELSRSLDDFFSFISQDNTGTYLNAYMLVDSNTGEIGLADMSDKHFVFFRSSGGPYTITTLPAGGDTSYDATMLDPQFMLGYNYSPSNLVRADLQATNSTPDRPTQLQSLLPSVTSLEKALSVITHNDPTVADSIFGRFDLNMGNDAMPFGSIDAKGALASQAQAFKALAGTPDASTGTLGFWMLYGTAHINGKPFIWSQSPWSSWPHPGVPDVVDGTLAQVNYRLK